MFRFNSARTTIKCVRRHERRINSLTARHLIATTLTRRNRPFRHQLRYNSEWTRQPTIDVRNRRNFLYYTISNRNVDNVSLLNTPLRNRRRLTTACPNRVLRRNSSTPLRNRLRLIDHRQSDQNNIHYLLPSQWRLQRNRRRSAHCPRRWRCPPPFIGYPPNN